MYCQGSDERRGGHLVSIDVLSVPRVLELHVNIPICLEMKLVELSYHRVLV